MEHSYVGGMCYGKRRSSALPKKPRAGMAFVLINGEFPYMQAPPIPLCKK